MQSLIVSAVKELCDDTLMSKYPVAGVAAGGGATGGALNCDKVKAPSPAATTEVLLGNAALAVPAGLEELAVTSVVAPAGGGGGVGGEGEKAVVR